MHDQWDVNGWDQHYLEGNIPWHSDAPNTELARVSKDWAPGKVLDIGCGLATNLLHLADRGFSGWGVDVSPEAIDRARKRAGGRLTLRVMNALDVGSLGQIFDYVIDMGCYHIHEFSPGDRPRYARVLRSVLKPGGELLLMCFSPKEPADRGGPRRVSREELEAVFGPLFELRELTESKWRATDETEGAWCWVSRWQPRADRRPPTAG